MQPNRLKPTAKKRSRRLSQKLREGAAILEGERYGDFAPGFLAGQVKQGRVTPAQIYQAVEHFGYRRQNGAWILRRPRWLETLVRKEDEKLLREW